MLDEEFTELMAKVAIAQAVYKTVARYVSTKGNDSLRAEFDAAIMDAYDQTGAKSFDMKVRGIKVGSISVRKSKEKEEINISITDKESFDGWLLDTGLGRQVVEYDQEAVIEYCLKTGEIPDGASIMTCLLPERATGTTLKIDVDKVAAACADQLPAAVSNLLTE